MASVMALELSDWMLTDTLGGTRQSLTRRGDRVELVIEGLGVLANPVALEQEYD